MTPDRESRTQALIPALQAGDDEALREAVELNLPLVTAMLARVHHERDERQELMQNGCVGLIQALRRFDPAFGVRFSTYAVPLILGEMRRVRREAGPVHLSRGVRQETAKLARLEEDLAQETGGEVPLSLLARKARIPVEEAAFLLAARADALPLDGTDAEDEASPALFLASSENTEEAAARHLLIRQAFALLDKRERRLLYLRYFEDRTQQETAAALAVSQVQISRLERRILAKLREQLSEVI